MSYDPKCYDLARDFLADDSSIDIEGNRAALAQMIQDTIEEFMSGRMEDFIDRVVTEVEEAGIDDEYADSAPQVAPKEPEQIMWGSPDDLCRCGHVHALHKPFPQCGVALCGCAHFVRADVAPKEPE